MSTKSTEDGKESTLFAAIDDPYFSLAFPASCDSNDRTGGTLISKLSHCSLASLAKETAYQESFTPVLASYDAFASNLKALTILMRSTRVRPRSKPPLSFNSSTLVCYASFVRVHQPGPQSTQRALLRSLTVNSLPTISRRASKRLRHNPLCHSLVVLSLRDAVMLRRTS